MIYWPDRDRWLASALFVSAELCSNRFSTFRDTARYLPSERREVRFTFGLEFISVTNPARVPFLSLQQRC